MAQADLKNADLAALPAATKSGWSSHYILRAGLVLLLAAVLRLLFLGRAAFHPDEAIHALTSSDFLDYRFDPVYHGPLLYHLEAFMLRVGGDSDFTARLVPALLGIVLVALILFSARRWLGENGALWGAALVAVSPVMVAYSRRLLHDSLVLALTMGTVLYFQAARENSSKTWEGREARIGVVLLLVLLLCTKANAFFIIAMLGGYWLSILLRPQSNVDYDQTISWKWLPLVMFGVTAMAARAAVRGGATEKLNEKLLLGACLFCCAALWEWLRRARRDTDEVRGEPDGWTPLLAVGLGIFLYAFLYGRGFLWPKDGITAESLKSVWNAMPRMLEYWRGQQGKPRLPGPHDYYIVLSLLYELPIVIAGAFGIVRACRVRTAFTDLLLWWCFTSFAIYALANEKVPWLMTHQILPLALLGGAWLGARGGEGGAMRRNLPKWAFAAFGAVFLLRHVAATSFGRAGDQREPLYYAQTTEAFAETFDAALRETQEASAAQPGDAATYGIWLHEDRWWPTSWTVRRPRAAKVPIDFHAKKAAVTFPYRLGVAVMPPDAWDAYKSTTFRGWRTWNIIKYPPGATAQPDFLVWSRSSWTALKPGAYWHWWKTRDASLENGVLAEWSHVPAIVATPQ